MFLNMKGTPIIVIVSLDSVELTANVEVLNLLSNWEVEVILSSLIITKCHWKLYATASIYVYSVPQQFSNMKGDESSTLHGRFFFLHFPWK